MQEIILRKCKCGNELSAKSKASDCYPCIYKRSKIICPGCGDAMTRKASLCSKCNLGADPVLKSLSVPQICWIAGIMEAEGYFDTAGRYFALDTTDEDVVDKLLYITGVGRKHTYQHVKRTTGYTPKPAWRWVVQRQANVRDLGSLFGPYLLARRFTALMNLTAMENVAVQRLENIWTGQTIVNDTLSEEAAAWLAGMLEGDGCFQLHILNNKTICSVQITSTDLDSITRSATLLGTKVVEKPKRNDGDKIPYTVSVGSRNTVKSILLAVHLWLLSRRAAKCKEILKLPNFTIIAPDADGMFTLQCRKCKVQFRKNKKHSLCSKCAHYKYDTDDCSMCGGRKAKISTRCQKCRYPDSNPTLIAAQNTHL